MDSSAGISETKAFGLGTLAVSEAGGGRFFSLCAESSGFVSMQEERAETSILWSKFTGEEGESIALPSEETGLLQRPSPCRYRMHFFFLLRTIKSCM